nr:hypothetical protein CFP56_12848 [Quercus suber]
MIESQTRQLGLKSKGDNLSTKRSAFVWSKNLKIISHSRCLQPQSHSFLAVSNLCYREKEMDVKFCSVTQWKNILNVTVKTPKPTN